MIVIPIPKPGKDPTNHTSYRPIALTSCICKAMERMINCRFVWYLESHKLLTNVQCGFRFRRSTIHHLVRFETFSREAFIHNQYLVSVFCCLFSFCFGVVVVLLVFVGFCCFCYFCLFVCFYFYFFWSYLFLFLFLLLFLLFCFICLDHTTWKYGIINDLHGLVYEVNMYGFFKHLKIF